MHITDPSGDLFSKCAACDKFNAAWFVHAALICPFVIVKLKEIARLHTLSKATKKCGRGFLHQLHLLLSTLADLEVLSLHDWQQENSLWFMVPVSKRCEGGWYFFSASSFLHSNVKLCESWWKPKTRIVHSRVNRNQFWCSFVFTNVQTEVILMKNQL